jgi:hypothetical protein
MEYPAFPVGVEANEVVDRGDGVYKHQVDAQEHQHPRHRSRSVRHLPPRRPGDHGPSREAGERANDRAWRGILGWSAGRRERARFAER